MLSIVLLRSQNQKKKRKQQASGGNSYATYLSACATTHCEKYIYIFFYIQCISIIIMAKKKYIGYNINCQEEIMIKRFNNFLFREGDTMRASFLVIKRALDD